MELAFYLIVLAYFGKFLGCEIYLCVKRKRDLILCQFAIRSPFSKSLVEIKNQYTDKIINLLFRDIQKWTTFLKSS